MKILIALLLITFSLESLGQNQSNDLNRSIQDSLDIKLYYEDFDYLIRSIENIDFYHLVNDKLKNQSFKKRVKIYRKEIKEINSNAEFLFIVYKVMNELQDAHGSLINGPQPLGFKKLIEDKQQVYVDSSLNFYKKVWRNYSAKFIKDYLPICYIDGKYFTYFPFQQNDLHINVGTELTKINGIDVHEFVNEHREVISNIKYDIENNLLYKDSFYKSSPLVLKEPIKLHFQHNEDDETLIDMTYEITVDSTWTRLNWQFSDNLKMVKILEEDILYIKLPLMNDANFYLNELDKLKGQNIEKVVIDIRGNPGGIDGTWQSILFKVVDSARSFNSSMKVGFKENYQTKRYFDSIMTWIPESDFVKKRKIDLLDETHLTFERNFELSLPDSSSLGYQGNIFILTDPYHYSSAGNFVNLARYNEDLISVGMLNGMYSGVQFTPTMMILPNTKIIYRMEPAIDYTNVSEFNDFYHNHVDIPYKYTVKDLFIMALFGDMVANEFYLNEMDPLIKIVKEYNKN